MPTFYIGVCYHQLNPCDSQQSYTAVPFKVKSEVLLNLDIVMKKKLVLYQSLLRKRIDVGTQLARGRGRLF